MSLVVGPFSLIHSTYLVNTDAGAMAMTSFNLPPIQRLLVTLDGEICARLQLFEAKQVGYHFVDHVLLLLFHSEMFVSVTSLFLLQVFHNLIGDLLYAVHLLLHEVLLHSLNMHQRSWIPFLIDNVIRDIVAPYTIFMSTSWL